LLSVELPPLFLASEETVAQFQYTAATRQGIRNRRLFC